MIRRDSSEQAALIEELAALCAGFFDDLLWLADCESIAAEQMPQAVRRLLVHNAHMTGKLKEHYDQPVALRVLDHREDAEAYRRKIMLTVDEGRRVVEFGLVRMDLSALDPSAKDVVLSRQTPLGEIFERFEVLTKVEPRWYVRFPSDSPVVQYLGSGTKVAYGRLGLIHCNGEPAVELLEVVPA